MTSGVAGGATRRFVATYKLPRIEQAAQSACTPRLQLPLPPSSLCCRLHQPPPPRRPPQACINVRQPARRHMHGGRGQRRRGSSGGSRAAAAAAARSAKREPRVEMWGRFCAMVRRSGSSVGWRVWSCMLGARATYRLAFERARRCMHATQLHSTQAWLTPDPLSSPRLCRCSSAAAAAGPEPDLPGGGQLAAGAGH